MKQARQLISSAKLIQEKAETLREEAEIISLDS